MEKEIKELDNLLTKTITRATKENDINHLKTILLKHLRNLGEDPILINTELPLIDVELQPLDIELEPLDIDLDEGLIIDPCPKTRTREDK
jgi:hypothetical protein